MIDTVQFIMHPEQFDIKIALMTKEEESEPNGMISFGYRHADMPGLEVIDSLRGPDSQVLKNQILNVTHTEITNFIQSVNNRMDKLKKDREDFLKSPEKYNKDEDNVDWPNKIRPYLEKDEDEGE